MNGKAIISRNKLESFLVLFFKKVRDLLRQNKYIEAQLKTAVKSWRERKYSKDLAAIFICEANENEVHYLGLN